MTFFTSLRIAAHGLNANRMRSALTMLGILIGVAAVIMLVAVGKGSSTAVQDQLNNLGTNTLIVSSGGFGGFGGGGRSQLGTQSRRIQLTLADVKALRDETNAPDVKNVAPVVTAQSVTGAYKSATSSIGQFIGHLARVLGDPQRHHGRGLVLHSARCRRSPLAWRSSARPSCRTCSATRTRSGRSSSSGTRTTRSSAC